MCQAAPGSSQRHPWLAVGSLWLSFGEPGAEPTPGWSLRGFVSTEMRRPLFRSLPSAVSAPFCGTKEKKLLRSLSLQDVTDLFSF